MVHQSHGASAFTQSLLQTARRNESHGMDSMSPKGLKVGFGRRLWFQRKKNLLTHNNARDALTDWITSVKMLLQKGKKNIWFKFVTCLLFPLELDLTVIYWAVGGHFFHSTLFPYFVLVAVAGERGDTLRRCCKSVSGTIIQKHVPDGVRGVTTTLPPLCTHYLVWLNSQKSRIWPQRYAETTNLSSGIRKIHSTSGLWG